MKIKWLDRRISTPGPFLTLCLSEKEFKVAMRSLNSKSTPEWCRNHATTHILDNLNGKLCCVVCLSDMSIYSSIEVAGLLVHEAVHVWQAWCENIGEHKPASEQEAYAIQSIAQELMAEYVRRL